MTAVLPVPAPASTRVAFSSVALAAARSSVGGDESTPAVASTTAGSEAATWREFASSRAASNALGLASGSMRASAHAVLSGRYARVSAPPMRRTAAAMSARSALLRERHR